jgi:hypothetical protein
VCDRDGKTTEEALALAGEARGVRVAQHRDFAFLGAEGRGVGVRGLDGGADDLDQSRVGHETPPDRDNLVYKINVSCTR